MPRRRRLSKVRVGALRLDSEHDDAFGLLLGGPGPDGLASDEYERLRGLWFAHRDELMQDLPPGMRPWPFYVFELGLKDAPDFSSIADSKGLVVKGPHELELEWLRKHGHLTVFEERELRRQREAREAS